MAPIKRKRNPVKKNMDKFHKPKTHKDKTKYDRKKKSKDLDSDWIEFFYKYLSKSKAH